MSIAPRGRCEPPTLLLSGILTLGSGLGKVTLPRTALGGERLTAVVLSGVNSAGGDTGLPVALRPVHSRSRDGRQNA